MTTTLPNQTFSEFHMGNGSQLIESPYFLNAPTGPGAASTASNTLMTQTNLASTVAAQPFTNVFPANTFGATNRTFLFNSIGNTSSTANGKQVTIQLTDGTHTLTSSFNATVSVASTIIFNATILFQASNHTFVIMPYGGDSTTKMVGAASGVLSSAAFTLSAPITMTVTLQGTTAIADVGSFCFNVLSF